MGAGEKNLRYIQKIFGWRRRLKKRMKKKEEKKKRENKFIHCRYREFFGSSRKFFGYPNCVEIKFSPPATIWVRLKSLQLPRRVRKNLFLRFAMFHRFLAMGNMGKTFISLFLREYLWDHTSSAFRNLQQHTASSS